LETFIKWSGGRNRRVSGSISMNRRKSMMPGFRREDLPLPIPIAMASRRKSLAPVPAAKPLAPPPAPKPVAARKVRALPAAATKATAASKAKAQPKVKADFVAAEAFDFGAPDDFDLPQGPMTRSRRTSIYARKADNAAVVPKKAAAPVVRKRVSKAAVEIPGVKEEEVPAAAFEEEAGLPVTSTAVKAKKTVPEIKMAEPLTPIVELKRMASKEYKTSNDRRKTVQKTVTKKTEIKTGSPPQIAVLSAIPLNLTPAKSTRKVQKKPVFLCTPQAVDPVCLLKKNLKKKVEENLDAKVAALPQNSSPYVMVNSGQSTENGSPIHEFVKIQRPENRAAASKFVTGTPAPTKAANKRGVFEPLEHQNDGSPELPKRRAVNDLKTPANPTPKRRSNILNKSSEDDVDHSAAAKTPTPKTKAAFASSENTSPATTATPSVASSPKCPKSPLKNTQLVTGDLVKACCIM